MMFWIGAFLLVGLACAFVLLPLVLVRREDAEDIDRNEINVAVYRERADLEGEQALLEEAQRDLLGDTVEQEPGGYAWGDRRYLLVPALLLPLMVVLVYADFGLGRGAIGEVKLTEQLAQLQEAGPDEYGAFAEKVEARLAVHPDDENLQYLMASVYSRLGRYEDAAVLYRAMLDRFPGDAGLLSQYAEVLFVADGRRMTDRATAAVDAALKANPMDLTMLEIRGIGAMMDGDAKGALNWFNLALQTGVSGERARLIRAAISQLQQNAPAPVAARTIDVAVSLESSASIPDTAAVFVYARAADGPPAPLAVRRLSPADLPAAVKLDDTMAMMPGMSLASFDRVIVIARLSIKGEVVPAPGDIEARSAVLELGEEPVSISLRMDRVIQ